MNCNLQSFCLLCLGVCRCNSEKLHFPLLHSGLCEFSAGGGRNRQRQQFLLSHAPLWVYFLLFGKYFQKQKLFIGTLLRAKENAFNEKILLSFLMDFQYLLFIIGQRTLVLWKLISFLCVKTGKFTSTLLRIWWQLKWTFFLHNHLYHEHISQAPWLVRFKMTFSFRWLAGVPCRS